MQTKLAPDDMLLRVADDNARDAEYLRSDIAATIFPASNQRVSEEMLAVILRDSRAVCNGLGAALITGIAGVDSAALHDIEQREDQRILHEGSALIEFLYARYCIYRLETQLERGSDMPVSQTLPARLLSDADHNVADCGQIILAASGMIRRGASPSWHELPATLLHQLCWRIVALLESKLPADVQGADALRTNARGLLAGHSENQSLPIAAQKFIHLAVERYPSEIEDVGQCGLAIFMAGLASKLRLDIAHVVQLIGSQSLSVIAVMQRAAAVDKDQAMANIALLCGFDMTPRDIEIFDEGYSDLSQEAAQNAVAGWHIARIQKNAGRVGLQGRSL